MYAPKLDHLRKSVSFLSRSVAWRVLRGEMYKRKKNRRKQKKHSRNELTGGVEKEGSFDLKRDDRNQ